MTEPQLTPYEETTRLLARTFRAVAILVAVTVVFVGGLSAAAVFLASKAVGASPTAETTPSAPSVKKPLSI